MEKSNPLVIGDSGGITIRANSLSLANGAKLIASTFGRGNAGSISEPPNFNYEKEKKGKANFIQAQGFILWGNNYELRITNWSEAT